MTFSFILSLLSINLCLLNWPRFFYIPLHGSGTLAQYCFQHPVWKKIRREEAGSLSGWPRARTINHPEYVEKESPGGAWVHCNQWEGTEPTQEHKLQARSHEVCITLGLWLTAGATSTGLTRLTINTLQKPSVRFLRTFSVSYFGRNREIIISKWGCSNNNKLRRKRLSKE